MTNVTARPGHNRALCCECGTLRTVGSRYAGPGPDYRDQEAWRRISNLKCATCRSITRHAVINDSGEFAGRDWAEEDNREADTQRRQVRRRLAGFAAEGVVVEWCDEPLRAAGDDDPRTAAIELRCNGPLEAVHVELWSAAPPRRMLATLDRLERLLDDTHQPLRDRLRAAPDGLVLS